MQVQTASQTQKFPAGAFGLRTPVASTRMPIGTQVALAKGEELFAEGDDADIDEFQQSLDRDGFAHHEKLDLLGAGCEFKSPARVALDQARGERNHLFRRELTRSGVDA